LTDVAVKETVWKVSVMVWANAVNAWDSVVATVWKVSVTFWANAVNAWDSVVATV
jgi:hypothetical protein